VLFENGSFEILNKVAAASPFGGSDSKDQGVVPLSKDTTDSNNLWGKGYSENRVSQVGFSFFYC